MPEMGDPFGCDPTTGLMVLQRALTRTGSRPRTDVPSGPPRILLIASHPTGSTRSDTSPIEASARVDTGTASRPSPLHESRTLRRLACVVNSRVERSCHRLAVQHDRHPIMNRRHQLVRISGQIRAAPETLSVLR